ncbi:hypothetical protein PVK06_017347 [Gossypium arboreum]|uniref:Uncharacterized protein n=1 Tax=Gossypium arboreum TaxID=29729 RepID=A0ABR0Q2Y4_GOSAR|nr:hypothetical protein PVK06_017347 [Gossypium arboreum]
MVTLVVLKLLGQSISYGALHNKINNIWAMEYLRTVLDYSAVDQRFFPLQPYPSVVMARIRLLRLSKFMYKRRVLEAIEGMVSKVAKLDFKIDSRTIGRFVRMAFFINPDGLLISQVLVNSETQQEEYRALPTICFSCCTSGHVKDRGG